MFIIHDVKVAGIGKKTFAYRLKGICFKAHFEKDFGSNCDNPLLAALDVYMLFIGEQPYISL